MTRTWVILVALLLAVLVLAIGSGPGNIGPGTALGVIGDHLLGRAPSTAGVVDALVWDLRTPRVLLVAAVGAALSVAGVVTQGLFRNPLAEPGVLGVGAGAGACAVLGFSLGLDQIGTWVTPTLCAIGAGVTLVALLLLSRGAHDPATLLLYGVALGAGLSAVTTLALAIDAERWDLGLKVVRWLMGSFEARSWGHLGAALPPILVGLVLAVWLRVDLDALHLGTDTGASLGLDLRRTFSLGLVAAALLLGAAVASAGVIAFVGLFVPHVARRLVGPGHARLLPAAAIGGAIALSIIDLGTRSIPRLVIPPGVVTAMVGAPFLGFVLRRRTREDA